MSASQDEPYEPLIENIIAGRLSPGYIDVSVTPNGIIHHDGSVRSKIFAKIIEGLLKNPKVNKKDVVAFVNRTRPL